MACTTNVSNPKTMKTLLLLLALVLCFSLARDKARSARDLMTHPNYPNMLVNPDQHVFNLPRAIVTV